MLSVVASVVGLSSLVRLALCLLPLEAQDREDSRELARVVVCCVAVICVVGRGRSLVTP